MRKPVPGVREFVCDECGKRWKEITRDCASPCGEHCPDEDCGSFTPPDLGVAQRHWPVDGSSNLDFSDKAFWDKELKRLKITD